MKIKETANILANYTKKVKVEKTELGKTTQLGFEYLFDNTWYYSKAIERNTTIKEGRFCPKCRNIKRTVL